MITLKQLIDKIETRQSVLNKEALHANKTALAKTVDAVASLNNAQTEHLTFLSKDKFSQQLSSTKAGVALVEPRHVDNVPEGCVSVVVQSAYLAYASCSQLFDTAPVTSIHPTAIISPTACIGNNVHIGAYTVIADNVQIGDNCHIANHVTIEQNSHIGAYGSIGANVVIASETQIGHHVRVHSGASIGAEGFGFAPNALVGGDPAQSSKNQQLGGWERIAQLGSVVIGNHVRIGANTTIDRGAIDNTIIADNVIIDNLVQIAHNVHIGAGTAIAAKSGIAGSSKLGKRCIVGGAVGITGHIHICDDVQITAMSMVTKSITKAGSYSSGNTAMPSQQWRRALVKLKRMAKK